MGRRLWIALAATLATLGIVTGAQGQALGGAAAKVVAAEMLRIRAPPPAAASVDRASSADWRASTVSWCALRNAW